MLFCETGGAWNVPMVMPWASTCGGVMTTATVDAGASAVVEAPGACAIGLVIVLVPVLMTVATCPASRPRRRRVPTEPLIDRSGREKPRAEAAMSSRDSSRSGAARRGPASSASPRAHTSRIAGNTEHLPAAEGDGGPAGMPGEPGRPRPRTRLKTLEVRCATPLDPPAPAAMRSREWSLLVYSCRPHPGAKLAAIRRSNAPRSCRERCHGRNRDRSCSTCTGRASRAGRRVAAARRAMGTPPRAADVI